MAFNFQKTTLTIALVIFIILMIFIGAVLYKNKYDKKYPPVIASCPDYWIDEEPPISADSLNNIDFQTTKCKNIKNLGKDSCSKTMNFTGEFWEGESGDCNKSKWAKNCDLSWDGITNNPDVCKNKQIK
tara:strand:+ start:4385 stop:4771 length:387 start_codon:yes stop_codon:yes gene_type:complete